MKIKVGKLILNLPYMHTLLLLTILSYRKAIFSVAFQFQFWRVTSLFWPVHAYSTLRITDIQFSLHIRNETIYTNLNNLCDVREENETLQHPGCKLLNSTAHFHCVFGKVNYPVHKVESCKCYWEENSRILIYFTGASNRW